VSRPSSLRGRALTYVRSQTAPVDPLDLFDRASGVYHDRVFWERPDEDLAIVGLGAAWAFTAAGAAPVMEAAAAWRSDLYDAVNADTFGDGVPWGAGPLAFGGFAFTPRGDHSGAAASYWDGFPSGKIVVPELTVSRAGRETWVTRAVMVPPGEGPAAHTTDEMERLANLLGEAPALYRPGADSSTLRAPLAVQESPAGEWWKEAVRRAGTAARDGIFTKVVLARSLKVDGVRLNAPQVLRRLRAGYPGCTLFAVATGDRCFLGATPERLIRLRGGEVRTVAIAGSARRGAAADEDRRLGEDLRTNPKDRLEHAVVVDVLKDVMAEVCAGVAAPAEPELLRVANVQHLATPIAGRLRESLSVLDLVERLHPTPAVGGFPRHAALQWIRQHEDLDRGWYAGPIGWINQAGEGEFAVAIRSAVMRGAEAVLFAGCGIVAGSDPDQEYAESVLKMRPLLEALGATGG